MVAITLPKGTRKVADNIKSLFCQGSYQNICALVAFFLLNKKSISELLRTSAFSKSSSSISRAINSFNPSRAKKRLWLKARKALRKSKAADLVYAVDDTANPKYGNIYGSSFWGSSSGIYHGQKVIVIVAIDLKRKLAVPVNYLIVDKSMLVDNTMIDAAVDLLRELVVFGFTPKRVVADSWFDSYEFVADIENLGLSIVWQVKSNRLVKTNPGLYNRWKHFREAFNGAPLLRCVTRWDTKKIRARKRKPKAIAEIFCQIKNRTKNIKIIAVYNRSNGVTPYGYFASSDLSISRAKIWELSRARWSIETIFRTVKQNLSFGRLSCTGEKAAHLAVFLPFYLYCTLQSESPSFWGIDRGDNIDLMLAMIRNKSGNDAIANIIHNPDSHQLQLIRNRRSQEYVSSKPLNLPVAKQKRIA